MSRRLLVAIVLVLLCYFSLVFAVVRIQAQSVFVEVPHTAAQEVFDICQASRIGNTQSEQRCGDVQDLYQYEYVCEQRNSSSANHCWVESKIYFA